MEIKKVSGKNKGHIMLYALSTCIWCKKTKNFLSNLHLEYEYIDVDLLNKQEQERVEEEINKWNPACSFPTIVINNRDCVLGYDPDEIKEKLGL